MAKIAKEHLPPEPYNVLIQRPLNQLALIAPLLLLYQIGSAVWGNELLVPDLLKVALESLGAPAWFLPPLLIVAVLFLQHMVRKDPWQLSGWTVGGMAGEAFLLTVPLLAVSWISTSPSTSSSIAAVLPWASAGGEQTGVLRGMLTSIGAGIYEEFLFRLVLFNFLALILEDWLQVKKLKTCIICIVCSGLLFGALHFSADQWFGDSPLPWGNFVFLSLAGMWWGILFIWRGFGIGAMSHVWWDWFVTISQAA